MMRPICILSLAALLPAQQQSGGDPRPAAIPAAEQAKLAAILPVPASFGFKPDGAARFYSSDLGAYLGSRAGAYHQYGLVAMAHQGYQSTALKTTVDLFDMGDPLRAFGIYAAERPPDGRFLEIGGEGYLGEGILNFFQGRYYAKISVTGKQAPSAPMLETIAKYISSKIWTGVSIPKEIARFPSRGLVQHSQKYLVVSPMGRDFLAPAATALYRFDGRETVLLVSMAASHDDALARVARLKQSFANSGGATAVAGMPLEAWRGTSRDDGEMMFFAQGRYAVVLAHPPSERQAFLKEIVSSIRD